MSAIEAARENGSELTRCSSLHHRQARNFAERIGHALDLFLIEFFRRDHAYARRRLIQRYVRARCRDDNGLGLRLPVRGCRCYCALGMADRKSEKNNKNARVPWVA